MRAIRQYELGGPSMPPYETVPDPAPGPDEVLIGVAACGVHLIDASLRRGEQPGPPLPTLPFTPGREVAGVVESPGPWSGRRVVAHLGPANGGYASLAVAPVSALHAPDPALSCPRAGGPSSTSASHAAARRLPRPHRLRLPLPRPLPPRQPADRYAATGPGPGRLTL